jgi:hypothetical protein
MKHGRNPRRHALAAPSSDPKSYQLRAASSFNSGLKVDREAGIIRGVALMSVGPAKGYGFEVDRTTLQQTFSLASGKPGGVKIRLGHPGNDTQAVLSAVGRVKNAHLDGDVLRGDVHLGTYAKSMPNGGNAWDYLLARAEEAPEDFGLSAVVHLEFDKSPTTGGLPIARARQLDAIDFVDNPAANHAGLLSAPPENVDPATKPTPVVPGIDPNPSLKGASSMDEVLKAYLLSLGLNPQATVEQAKTFFVSLSTERQNAAPSQDKIPADWKPAPVTLATKVEPTFVELETKRVKDITSLCALYPGLPTDFVQKQIALNVDLEKVKTNALAAIATANPNPGGGRPGSILVGDDQAIAAHRQAMSDAILIRAGRKVEKPHELATKLAGRKVLEMGPTLHDGAGRGRGQRSERHQALGNARPSPEPQRAVRRAGTIVRLLRQHHPRCGEQDAPPGIPVGSVHLADLGPPRAGAGTSRTSTASRSPTSRAWWPRRRAARSSTTS